MLDKDPRLSQRQLAEELNVSHNTINKLYNGRPLTARFDPETIEKICDYFGCDIGDLFELKGGGK
jgi:putative transcriptional regulator